MSNTLISPKQFAKDIKKAVIKTAKDRKLSKKQTKELLAYTLMYFGF